MDQRKRIEFLQQASIVVPPSVSRSLLNKAQDLSIRSNELLSPKIERSFCSRCGTLFSPGLDTKVDIVNQRAQKLSGHKRKMKGQKRQIILDRLAQDKGKQPSKLCSYVVYKCQICSARTILSGATVEDDSAIKAMKTTLMAQSETDTLNNPLAKTTLEKASTSTEKSSTSNAGSIDKKKKKRKGNLSGLQQLMEARKKQKEDEATSSGGLNLEDFLSNL
jgi:RNase P subunit RPR2